MEDRHWGCDEEQQSLCLNATPIPSIPCKASGKRFLIAFTDGHAVWTTVGVSTDIIEASSLALVDSIEYRLARETVRKSCIA
jgi:hypothetical protein